MKLKTKVQTYWLCVSSPFSHLVWSSFGSVALAMSVIISGGGRTLHILPTHPSFPPPPLDNMQIYFGKYTSQLLWTTCKYILANILPTSFRQHADISCTSFGHHSDIFGQILNFPSFFWTTCKYIFANILPTSFGHHADIFLLYFPSSLWIKCKYVFADIFPPALDYMQLDFLL